MAEETDSLANQKLKGLQHQIDLLIKNHRVDINYWNKHFTHFSRWASHVTGRALAFNIALVVILVWVISGPLFQFSDTWQLIINTATTIVTFLMVFLIQHTQNRDTQAMHSKLDELIRSIDNARKEYLNLENLEDDEFQRFKEKHDQDFDSNDS
ncbi:MAG: low affinity iron permease family protein [Gammaproteobacteria bacterium]